MTSSRTSRATSRGQCVTRTACELCREKRAKCDGENPCGRCQARSLDCHYTNRAWTSKRDLQDQITSRKEQLHRRDYLLDAVCATAGSVNDALGILRYGGLSYDEAYDKVRVSSDTSALSIDTTMGQGRHGNVESGEYETNWSPSTANSTVLSSTSGQSLFSSLDSPFTDGFVCQSPIASDQSFPKLDLLQQQMDPVQSIPWADSSPEVRSAVTPSSAQACHHQSRTTCGEEAEASSSKPTKTKRPRKAGSKARKQADAAVRATLDQDGIPKDPQRRKATERSRMASNKCRARKRDDVSTLASREQAMNSQNRELSKRFNALQAEVFTLKAPLLQHTDCSGVLIQSYVANEVERSIDGLVTGPAALLPSSAQAVQINPAAATRPDLQVASSTSAAAESTHMQSPMMAAPGERRQSPSMEGLAAGLNVVPAQELDGEQHKQATSPAYHPSTSPMAEPLVPHPDWYQMDFGGVQYSNGFMNDVMEHTELQL